jgi:hypothetical protein
MTRSSPPRRARTAAPARPGTSHQESHHARWKAKAVAGAGLVIAVVAAAGCGSAHLAAKPRATEQSPSPAPVAAAPVITAAQERFIDAARGRFPAVAKGDTATLLAGFETDVCQYFQGGSNATTAEQEAQAAWTYNWMTPPPSPGTITKVVMLAARDGCRLQLAAVQRLAAKQARQAQAARREARQDAAAAAAARRLANTVTYVVTGSAADVTYGPSGSDFQGSVPMNVSAHLRNPLYYAISAQLQGGGQVSCAILVGGKVISSATATGGYNIATCEISQDPLYGGWTNTNGG